MATTGEATLLDTGTVPGPLKAFLGRVLGGRVDGGQGCPWWTPEPLCHSATTWHCSIHNAPGQHKGGIVIIAQPYDDELTVHPNVLD